MLMIWRPGHSSSGCAFLACLGLLVGSANQAFSYQAPAIADAVSAAYKPTQLSALIAAAAGKTPAGTDQSTPSLEPLQQALDVNGDVAVALLRIFDRADIRPGQVTEELAQSAVGYHEVNDGLTELKQKIVDVDEQQMLAQAQMAMTSGRFDDAVAQLQQVEEREVISSGPAPVGATATQITDPHRVAAAQVQTLLGKIAFMRLQFVDAAADFHQALLQMTAVPSPPEQPLTVAPPQPAGTTTVAAIAGPPTVTDAAPAAPAGGQPNTVANVTDPDTTQRLVSPPAASEEVPAAPRPLATALATPTQPPPPPVVNETVTKPPAGTATLSPDVLAALLHHGDGMLALGDFASARLLYERAAAAGDARGAIGVARTYDPRVLSQMGARGIAADPAMAAKWYRRALQLGDPSAATRLKELDQAAAQ
jgi:hypothetical protein